MAYYPTDARCRQVEAVLRAMEDRGIHPTTRRLIESCPTMSKAVAWKAVKVLCDRGVVIGEDGRAPCGQPCILLRLEDWYRMDEDQRERTVRALESIADSQLRMAEIMDRRTSPAPVFNGPVSTVNTGTVIYEAPKRETKVVGPEEVKG